jgi:hypothetical protein
MEHAKLFSESSPIFIAYFRLARFQSSLISSRNSTKGYVLDLFENSNRSRQVEIDTFDSSKIFFASSHFFFMASPMLCLGRKLVLAVPLAPL